MEGAGQLPRADERRVCRVGGPKASGFTMMSELILGPRLS